MWTTSRSCSRRRWSASRLWAPRGAVVKRATLLPVDGRRRARTHHRRHDRNVFHRCDRVADGRRRSVLRVRQHNEVGDENPVRIEVAGEQLEFGGRVGDENAAACGDRRHGGSAALEDDEVGSTLGSEPRARRDVRGRDRSGEPAARAPAADRVHARERRVLEVVGGRVVPFARQLQELVERRAGLGNAGSAGPPRPIATTSTLRSRP